MEIGSKAYSMEKELGSMKIKPHMRVTLRMV
jgi:hypothetical protein